MDPPTGGRIYPENLVIPGTFDTVSIFLYWGLDEPEDTIFDSEESRVLGIGIYEGIAEIFTDGFESGDVSAWTRTVP